jgi:hypothetical protein
MYVTYTKSGFVIAVTFQFGLEVAQGR